MRSIWLSIVYLSPLFSGLALEARTTSFSLTRGGASIGQSMREIHCDVSFRVELQLVMRRFPPGVRIVFVHLERQFFTRENLKIVFSCLSEHYLQPANLSVSVSSDGDRLRRNAEKFLAQQGIRRDGSFEREVKPQTDPLDDTDERPKELGCCWASYDRSEVREEMSYLDSNKQRSVREVIRMEWPNHPTHDKNSDLVNAVTGGLELVTKLLENGATVNGASRFGTTPLLAAIEGAPISVVKTLLDRGADVNRADSEGWTPLMYSIAYRRSGRSDITQELLSRGADVRARAANGDTALAFAAESGAADVVGELLKRGADPNVKDRYGRTPSMIAKQQGYTTILNLLKSSETQKQ